MTQAAGRSITLLVPNYPPESNSAAKRIAATAEHLARRGWRVRVVTLLPHYPQNRIYEGYDVPTPLVRREGGVEVVRLRPWIVPKDSLPLRLLSETRFSLQALGWALRQPTDVLFASSPYMFLGPLGLLAARLRRAPFVWDVRDLTWLYPKAAGKRTYGLERVLAALMRFTARSSDALTTATQGLLEYFTARPARSRVIPNGVTDEVLAALEPTNPGARAPGSRPQVVYSGLFGYNQGLGTLVEAAKLLPEADVTLVGDGPEKGALVAQAAGASNVSFLPYQPFAELGRIYQQADVLVAHVRRDPVHRWAQPAKLWEYMASGRPVVHAGEGEAIEILEQNGVALTVPPEDPEALAAAVKWLLTHPDEAAAMARRARAFVEGERRRETLLAQLEALLLEVSEPHARR